MNGSATARVAQLLQSATHALALTGAGISTASGIPDFRSPESGLWSHTNAMEIASLRGFRYNPKQFYDWMHPLSEIMHNAEPNPAHFAFAELELRALSTVSSPKTLICCTARQVPKLCTRCMGTPAL